MNANGCSQCQTDYNTNEYSCQHKKTKKYSLKFYSGKVWEK